MGDNHPGASRHPSLTKEGSVCEIPLLTEEGCLRSERGGEEFKTILSLPRRGGISVLGWLDVFLLHHPRRLYGGPSSIRSGDLPMRESRMQRETAAIAVETPTKNRPSGGFLMI